MIAAACAATGAPQEGALGRAGGPKTGRGRWQDKRTGTFQVHVVDGVEKFPGPRVEPRAYPDDCSYKINNLSGTLRAEPRHGG